MKKLLLSAAALALIGAGSLASAGNASAYCAPYRHNVNPRIYHQDGRIYQGVRSGELTRGEARDLRHDDRQIHREEWRDRWANGGRLTPYERRDLQHDLNQQSREIYAYKHNGPERWWAK
jgi:hypothetical protein